MDAIEAVTNATVGLLLSIATVSLLWPVFGWSATISQSVAVTAVFWALSAVRTYTIRKIFRRLS